MSTLGKSWFEKYQDKRIWNKISMNDLRKETRRLDVEIEREQKALRALSKKEEKFRRSARSKTEIEMRGLAKQIKSLRREAKSHEVILTGCYNQKTVFKQIELYKTMKQKAQKKGLQKFFRKHQERIMDLIIDQGVEITDEIKIWDTLAKETDVVLDSVLESDDEEEEIMAELMEEQLDDELEDLELDDDLQEEQEIVTIKKKRYRKE